MKERKTHILNLNNQKFTKQIDSHQNIRSMHASKQKQGHTRRKSIHALTPLQSKPINNSVQSSLKNRDQISNNELSFGSLHAHNYTNTNQSLKTQTRKSISQQAHIHNFNLVQSLFTDESVILKKLREQGRELQQQKQRLMKGHQQQYMSLVQKLIETRRLCTQRKQDFEILQEQLYNIQKLQYMKDGNQIIQQRSWQNKDIKYDEVNQMKNRSQFTHISHSVDKGQIAQPNYYSSDNKYSDFTYDPKNAKFEIQNKKRTIRPILKNYVSSENSDKITIKLKKHNKIIFPL